jgi:hypothetical protein
MRTICIHAAFCLERRAALICGDAAPLVQFGVVLAAQLALHEAQPTYFAGTYLLRATNREQLHTLLRIYTSFIVDLKVERRPPDPTLTSHAKNIIALTTAYFGRRFHSGQSDWRIVFELISTNKSKATQIWIPSSTFRIIDRPFFGVVQFYQAKPSSVSVVQTFHHSMPLTIYALFSFHLLTGQQYSACRV